MKEETIVAVANAITANAEVLKSLIEALPKEAVARVEKHVAKAETQAPVTTVPVSAAPVTIPVAVVAPAPAPAPVNMMPAAPFPMQPVASLPATPAPTVAMTPAPVAAPVAVVQPTPVVVAPVAVASPSNAPFSEHKGMIAYVMDAYKTMGSTKGAMIQGVLDQLGTKNINDVQPAMYGALYAGVEALKAS